MVTIKRATEKVRPLQQRIIMLADFDYFFAQAEEVRNPSIKDKPVVVCVYSGRTEDSGVVSTANYNARKYGVKSGMPIFMAKKKLEDTDSVFLPVDESYYEQVSNNIMNILKAFADNFQQVGIDEAYLDVTQRTEANYEKAQELAQKIKAEVKIQQKITCSIGVGPNKLIAKIAADNQKPNGLTTVKPEQVIAFLTPLPVGSLIGVGNKTQQKLEPLGIKTIGDLAEYPVQRLIDIFGKSHGVYLHDAAQGIDFAPVQEAGETESISRISTLKENTRELEAILERAYILCEYIHQKVMQRKIRFRRVSATIILKDLSIHNRYKKLESATDRLETFKEAAGELLEKLLADTELEVRRVGVRISYFVSQEEQERQKQMTDFFRQA